MGSAELLVLLKLSLLLKKRSPLIRCHRRLLRVPKHPRVKKWRHWERRQGCLGQAGSRTGRSCWVRRKKRSWRRWRQSDVTVECSEAAREVLEHLLLLEEL